MCCGCNASYSKRISAETSVEVIGGADKYLPTCRECYHNPSSHLRMLATPERPKTKAKGFAPERGESVHGSTTTADANDANGAANRVISQELFPQAV